MRRFLWIYIISHLFVIFFGCSNAVPASRIPVTPCQIVEKHLYEMAEEDWVVSLKIDRVIEVDNKSFVQNWKGTERWIEEGWSEENISVVDAFFEAYFTDSTEGSAWNEGRLYQQFYLIRDDQESEWEIWDAMSAYDNAY